MRARLLHRPGLCHAVCSVTGVRLPAPPAPGAEMDDGESLATGVTRASGKATSVVPGLGVVVHSMKRGDHTARQKQRKVVKVKKVRSLAAQPLQSRQGCRVAAAVPGAPVTDALLSLLMALQALARMDKVGTKLDGKQRRRTNKLGLKHMY